jgi:hypothetical protein
VLRALRKWLADRRERKLGKYAEEYGFMDRAELDRLRQQQSPLRGRRGYRR